MKKLILLVTITLAYQLVKGANPPAPVGSVTCYDDHKVDISIINVDDLGEWTAAEWQLEGNGACQPTLSGSTVTYTNLNLPDCATSSEELTKSVLYVLTINPTKSGLLQARSYEHLYYVSCEYNNENRSMASFIPIKHRGDNDSSTSYFTFQLDAFYKSDHTGVVPNPVALNTTLYFKASVVTQSVTPNLDLFIEVCYASNSSSSGLNPGSSVRLIKNGCGSSVVSQDDSDTLSYTCAADSVDETFSIRTFRFFGSAAGAKVYFHCELKVCLADTVRSACECPTLPCGSPTRRKRRRSVADMVDESEVYYVTAGPFIFQSQEEETKEKEKEKEVNKEGGSGKQDGLQSFSTNLTIIVTVSGVVVVAIVCTTVFLLIRKRRQHGDLSLLTDLPASPDSPVM